MGEMKVLKCDFCGSLGSTKACIINGSRPTVYDKDGTAPRAPAICDECALLITNMGIRAVKSRLALVESARKVFSMPPTNPLSIAKGDEKASAAEDGQSPVTTAEEPQSAAAEE